MARGAQDAPAAVSSSPKSRQRRVERLLLCAAFVGFAWFHQGGGWNQNGRFAMVRAVVEEGHLWIDSYLVYARAQPGGSGLARAPVRDGAFELGGRRHVLEWTDAAGRSVPLAGLAAPRGDAAVVDPGDATCTGDLAWHGGHFHPNKAPGLSLLAVPGYLLVHRVERWAGLDPDDAWTLTLNAWLVSVLSVALVSALGTVIVYRLARALSAGATRESLLAALTFAFGTMIFPYATMLYEHDVVAVALVASFYLLYAEKERGPDARRRGRAGRLRLALAGACAGWAAITNYLMAAAVLMLLAYLVLGVRRPRGGWWFGLGVLLPFAIICAYNVACFGTPFTTNYRHQNPLFQSGGAFLGVFLAPRLDVLLAVLVSPFRGLFYTAPVLVMGVYGLARCWRDRRLRAEAWLMTGLVAFVLLFVCSFNGWDGGWAVGPRYLVPALPFLAAPLALAFRRFFRLTLALAAISAAVALLVTAVDPQSPVTESGFAGLEGTPRWRVDHLRAYEWPLFATGRPWPILEAQRERAAREHRDPPPSELSTLEGPVSVNPMGMYEGYLYRVFPAGSPQARWNSFNVGELLFPRSRWSLVPLVLIVGALVGGALRAARPR